VTLDEIDTLMQSFEFERCAQRGRLAQTLAADGRK
jgi:hypothetical protein